MASRRCFLTSYSVQLHCTYKHALPHRHILGGKRSNFIILARSVVFFEQMIILVLLLTITLAKFKFQISPSLWKFALWNVCFSSLYTKMSLELMSAPNDIPFCLVALPRPLLCLVPSPLRCSTPIKVSLRNLLGELWTKPFSLPRHVICL